mmetsp:Transcript_98710/g.274650  ORF Transcript_98710/g.274650 Transcript_98710/m.274650 type:complete len:250 (+) Transcript_98710:2154-2903(+)
MRCLSFLEVTTELVVRLRSGNANLLNHLADCQGSSLLPLLDLLLLPPLFELRLLSCLFFLPLLLSSPFFHLATPALLLVAPLLLQGSSLPLDVAATPILVVLPRRPGGRLRRRGRVVRPPGRGTASRGELQGLVHGAVPRHAPPGCRRQGRRAVAVVGPDLVAADFGAKPPAAEAWAIALVPEIDEHINASRRALLLVHGFAVVRALGCVGTLDNVGNCWVAASADVHRRRRPSTRRWSWRGRRCRARV